MHVIPVIDIRNGEVVRAVAGERANYRPIVTPLARTSAPSDVVAGFLNIYHFNTIYVADLDAIEGRGDNRAAIAALANAFPRTRLMIDAGARFRDWRGAGRVDVVLGSESLPDVETLRAMSGDSHVVLSLDFREDIFLGPEGLFVASAIWPPRIIVMTLARVGARAGPDFARFSQIIARAGDRRVYVAGGVRGADDLARLEEIGAAGALVATALHDGRLTPSALMRFEPNPTQ